MKKNLFIAVFLFVSVCLFGQGPGEIDAYRFSKNDLSGTARGQAMGGAFGALGGDMTGVAINPAGIGIYRRSEVIFNAALTFNQTKALFNGTEEKKGNTKLSCDNFAYIGYFPLRNDDSYSLNFGFNYNRLKSFDRKYQVSGKDMASSLTDYMAEAAHGTQKSWWDKYAEINDQFYSNDMNSPRWLGILGWNGYLINANPNSNNAYESLLNKGETVDPKLVVHERGSIGAYDFTLGANLNDMLYVGTTLTYTDISYVANTLYSEKFDIGGFGLDNEYNTEGSGLQLKLGVIFKPVDALRLGVSYHSPTWYNLTDYYRGILTPNGIYDGGDMLVNPVSTPEGAYYEYNFRTPDVWTFSVAAVLGKVAVISLDYEYKDYAGMKFSKRYANDYDFGSENDYIKEDFKSSSTIRAGAEIRFTPRFSGRLGTAWTQNPYESAFKNSEVEIGIAGTIPNYTFDGNVLYLTTGIGYRFTPSLYMDVALVYRTQQDELHFFSPVFYDDGNSLASTPSKLTNSSLKTLVTFGYKF
ncbi:MAG: outer membrane protein transport protein [Dysgonamonadaceae bacterium]|jgi:hypothetical protein|nr:outer membrane protein transport protein [Dysgonamonadaceae bacterium]